jgi:RecB family nuclease, putative, TM0106 family
MEFTLDAYAARSCPVKTHHAFHPGMVRPEDPAGAQRLPGAAEFSATVIERLSLGKADVVDLRRSEPPGSEAEERACLTAMDAGADVIIGGLLPRDWAGHRQGRAELLIRDPSGGYVPGTIKFQRVVDSRRDDQQFSYSLLDDLPGRRTGTGWRYRWHWRWANAVQLAHLWRLLENLGQAAAGGPAGVVIGNEITAGDGPLAVWLDLTEASVPAPAKAGVIAEAPVSVSALERYDAEFAERVGLAEAAAASAPQDPPLLAPVVNHECGYCPWWTLCRAQLDDDDLSLRISKSPLDAHEITVLRNAGITTVRDLAGADLEELLPSYLPQVQHRFGAEDRIRLAQRRSRLLHHGRQLDRLTAGPIPLPRADLEIDIDIETSREDRVYLWGFWVDSGDQEPYYRSFAAFEDLDEAQEQQLARSAMAWLRELVTGRESLVFHYSDYELIRLQRLTRPGDEVLEWANGYAKQHFVDLFALVRTHFFGANGLGLKVVASAGAGFHWRDEDPGGLNSMIWFDEAVHAEQAADREQATQRVLDYNEDDVRATWALRGWLRQLH